MQERMLEVALRAAELRDAAGRTLRSLGDLVGSLPPADPAEPAAQPPALAADLALADAVSALLSGPHSAAASLAVVGTEGDRVTYSARDVFATLAAALAHSTLFDPLTGLPTRRWLLDEVDRRLAGASPTHPVGVLQVELGQLKDINDSLGYELGDALIKEAARRLSTAIGPPDAVGRLVGDEFAIGARRPAGGRPDRRCGRLRPPGARPARPGRAAGRARAADAGQRRRLRGRRRPRSAPSTCSAVPTAR